MNEFDIEVETNPERIAEYIALRDAAAKIEIKVHRLNGKVISGNVADVIVEEKFDLGKAVFEQVQKHAFAPTVETEVKSTPKAGTKLEQALDIYKNLEDKSRKNVIKTFIEKLTMTPAGASTYQYMCKKQLGV